MIENIFERLRGKVMLALLSNPFSKLDAYERKHVVKHLAEARRNTDAQLLLQIETGSNRNAWYDLRTGASELSGYLADIGVVWRASESFSLEDGARASIVDQYRYALITAVVSDLSENIPGSLIGPIVRSGIWSIDQAVTIIKQSKDWTWRVWGLFGLATEFPSDGSDVVPMLLEELHRPSSKLSHRSVVVPGFGSGPDMPQEYLRGCIIHRLVQELPEQRERLLEIANELPIPWSRAWALAGFIPYYTTAELSKPFAAAAEFALRVADQVCDRKRLDT